MKKLYFKIESFFNPLMLLAVSVHLDILDVIDANHRATVGRRKMIMDGKQHTCKQIDKYARNLHMYANDKNEVKVQEYKKKIKDLLKEI